MTNQDLVLKLNKIRKWLWLLLASATLIELFFLLGVAMEAIEILKGNVVQGRLRSLIIMLCGAAFMGCYLYKLLTTAKSINSVNLATPETVAGAVVDLWRYQALVSFAVGLLTLLAVLIPAY